MSDDLEALVARLRSGSTYDDRTDAADLIEAQAAEITRLRAALATARREGMEEAAKRLEELHKNHNYDPESGTLTRKLGRYDRWPESAKTAKLEHDAGYYRAIAEGVAHIRAAAGGGEVMDWQPIETAPRDKTWFVIINANDPDSVEVGRYNPLKLHRYEDAGNGLFRKVAYIGCEWDGFNNFHNATHWRPAFDKLPAPPEDREI